MNLFYFCKSCHIVAFSSALCCSNLQYTELPQFCSSSEEKPVDHPKADSSVVLYLIYCIVYITLLAVHTNQKRFKCVRSREQRAVLRERKEALGSPANKVDVLLSPCYWIGFWTMR